MPATPQQRSRLVTRPKLHDGVWAYKRVTDDLDSVVLLFGQSAHLLEEVYYTELIPLLDGSLTIDEIVSQLADTIAEEDVKSFLERLTKRQLIHDAAMSGPAGAVGRSLDGMTVGLQVFGGLSSEPMVDVLQRKGASLADGAARADITVVLTDHYLRPELEAFNLSANQPWIMLGPNGHDMWIGPLFAPEETACWDCLAHRLRINRKVEQYVWLQTSEAQIPPVQSEMAGSIAPAAFEMAAGQIARWRDNPHTSILLNQLAVLDSARLGVTHHKILRRPQCPSCGSSEVEDPQPFRLAPLPQMGSSGTDSALGNVRGSEVQRDVEAKATLVKFADHVSPITGLVPALKKRTDAPGIHVFKGGRYIAQTSKSWKGLQDSLEQHAAGKGVTEVQAQASALAETLEWYSLGAPANCKLVQESFTRLSTLERVLPPEKLVHFSADQLAEAERARASGEQVPSDVPKAFDPDTIIDWRPVWSMTKEEWVHVPAAFCSWGSTSPFIPSDSNGAAAGISREHAILHGFNELIERDAIALWWYNRVARPAVALEDLDTGFIASMRAYQHSLGYDFWLLDITSDFKIPAYVAVSINESGNGAIAKGFGAHSDPHVAATRALTELNQQMPVIGQFVPRADRPVPGKFDVLEMAEMHLRPDLNASPSRLDQFSHEYRYDVVDGISAALERSHSLGLEFLVADLTQPDVEMPVVKVIVPGVRRAYREFAPGRLYDIPVELGWRSLPAAEAEVSEMPSPM